MKSLFGWIVLLVLLAVAWKHGRPWLEGRMDSGSSSRSAADAADGPGRECLLAAREARDVYGSAMSSLGSPGEADLGWRSGLDDAISSARGSCRCSSAACERGDEALDLLEEASRELADPSRIGEAAMAAARRLQRVDELLDGP